MIKDNEISVIVQGPIIKGQKKSDNMTELCIASIRQILPMSEIILSTWANSDTSDLDADTVIKNDDPMNYNLYMGDSIIVKNNVDRQIVSTLNGLKASNRKYCLKLRTDAIVTGTGFVQGFQERLKRCNELRLLDERIVCPSTYNPKRTGLLFYFNDWFQFGQREDLIKIWDVPTTREKHGEEFDCRKANYFTELIPEQYIWSEFLLKYTNFEYLDKQHYTEELYEISERSIINNTNQMEIKKFGVLSQKHPIPSQKSQTYSRLEWLKLYKEYCDAEFIIERKELIKGIPISMYKTLAKGFYSLRDIGQKRMPSLYWKLRKIYRNIVK